VTIAGPGLDGTPRDAARPASAPPLQFVLLALAGGAVEGAGLGVLYTLAVFLPLQLFDPASEGGTGSPGQTTVAMMIGCAIGAVTGAIMGAAAAAGLVVAWAYDLRTPASVAFGGAAMLIALTAWVVVIPDAGTLVIASIASVRAVGGLIALDRWARTQK